MTMTYLKSAVTAVALATAILTTGAAMAEGGTPTPPKIDWSFSGPFGVYDRGATQRGFQVYKEVCSACHSMNLLHYRQLEGIGYSKDEIKAIAATVEVTDGPNDEGDMFTRPGKPADRFVAPFANSKAAAASNNGKAPPDLTLMVKARKGGADYVHGILTGYKDTPPAGVQIPDGGNYNEFFPGHVIAMAPPLSDDAVEYSDGTKATLDQEARDVATFLAWAAEPEMEARKTMGIKVLLFLLVLTGMLYAVKRQVWKDQH